MAEAVQKDQIDTAVVPPRKRRRLTRVRAVIGLLLVVGLIGLALFAYWWFNRPLLDRSTIEQVSFPVYAPKDPPEGYMLDRDKVDVSSSALTYTFVNSETSREIVVTVQPTPVSFDMARIIGNGAISSTAVSSGTLYNLSAGGSSKFLLDTGGTLVFLTSAESIDTTTVNALADSLIKVN